MHRLLLKSPIYKTYIVPPRYGVLSPSVAKTPWTPQKRLKPKMKIYLKEGKKNTPPGCGRHKHPANSGLWWLWNTNTSGVHRDSWALWACLQKSTQLFHSYSSFTLKTPKFLVSTNFFQNFQNFTPCVVRSITDYKCISTHTVLMLLVLVALWMFIPCSLMLVFWNEVLCVPTLK